ncbi:SRPBCC family protein [Brachybacterium huguangmaarense]
MSDDAATEMPRTPGTPEPIDPTDPARQSGGLGSLDGPTRVVSASRAIDAPAGAIFELIADPARQPEWDGNDNLGEAASGQRIRQVGDVFAMTLTQGAVRENHVVEFEEGRRLAWLPAPEGEQPPGHLWRWELEPSDDGGTLVIHTYDWTDLHDPKREARARATTAEMLRVSIDRLAELAEREA